MHGQPIVSPDGTIYGQEFLLRLIDEEIPVAAGLFIDAIAPDTKLMWAVDRWVIEEALKLDCQGYRHINVSPPTCCKENFGQEVIDAIASSKLNPTKIHFEITERTGVASYANINLLKNIGCQFGIDDFMTGFNSFDSLKLLNPSFIKIPGRLVNFLGDKIADTLIDATFGICAALSIKAIAESIETDAAWQSLLKINNNRCDLYGQGYLFGKPQKCQKLSC